MNTPGMRPCNRCGGMFSTDLLQRAKTRGGGVVYLCTTCLRIWRRLKVKVK